MSTKFPINAANWCLKENNLTWNDLDQIVVPWNLYQYKQCFRKMDK